MKRCILIVLDGAGAGALPDAHLFGDEKAATLRHVLEATGFEGVDNLRKYGLFHIDGIGLPGREAPKGAFGRCASKSGAKDTTSGHFELTGLIMEHPYKVFGTAFPARIINELEKRIGTKVIGNCPASGTEIIWKLGDEHVETGYPIVYLSADSLMQIAMHEQVIPLARQYEICRIARELLMGDDTVGRIIARPFEGKSGCYYRTENRRDFALDPPGDTVLVKLLAAKKEVIGVGKIEDIFNKVGLSEINHTKNNRDGIAATLKYLEQDFEGLLFTNLVDFDMLYGHRNDPAGFKNALAEFDEAIPAMAGLLGEEDILIVTADHGCDPTIPGTDHTREYIPVVILGPKVKEGVNLGTRESFMDIGATIADYFQIDYSQGKSFLNELIL